MQELICKRESIDFFFQQILKLPNDDYFLSQVKGILTIKDPNQFLSSTRKNFTPVEDLILATEYKGMICVKKHLMDQPEHLVKHFLEHLVITRLVQN